MSNNFSDYLMEYQAEGIGNLLYSLVMNIVAQSIKRYSPAIYSPNGVWDEDAISGLCHDFTIEKLLKAGWLEHYLLALETAEQLRRVLQRDFRHFLVNQRQRTEFQNLVQRVYKMLRENPSFKQYSLSTQRGTWGLRIWNSKQHIEDIEIVVGAMYKIPLPPLVRKYSVENKKLPYLLSQESLLQLLEGTFSELDACVDFDLLVDALKYRLNLYDIEIVSLDEPIGQLEDDTFTMADTVAAPAQDLEIDLRDIAQGIFTKLSDRQRQVLVIYQSMDNPTLEQIGALLQVSKSTIGNDLKIVQQHITSVEVTDSEAERLFNYLFELCVEQQEGI